jgi:hypothetical protein
MLRVCYLYPYRLPYLAEACQESGNSSKAGNSALPHEVDTRFDIYIKLALRMWP